MNNKNNNINNQANTEFDHRASFSFFRFAKRVLDPGSGGRNIAVVRRFLIDRTIAAYGSLSTTFEGEFRCDNLVWLFFFFF